LEIFEATLALLAAALVLSALAGRLAIPYPSFLVVGGLVLGFLPIVPGIELDPGLAFTLFLPPILFEAAYYTSWRDFRANGQAIGGLAIALVAFSTFAIARVADWLIPEMPLGAAVVLGAIVSPPDAAAATAVLRRMRLPRRVVAIVEGESLVNDAVALVIYNFAVAAVVTGRVSASDAALALLATVAGSLAIGFVIGWAWTKLAERLADPLIAIAMSFMVAFGAYLAAERLDLSGVLSVVAAGLYFAWKAPTSLSADARLGGAAVWRLVIFVLNALAFVLIGLQLPQILGDLKGYSLATLAKDGAVIAGTAIVIRLAWVLGFSQTLRLIARPSRKPNFVDWREAIVIGWSGMRGLVSLAAALALPDTTIDGAPFPARALVLFLSFAVILGTLVVQGLSLGSLVRLLGLDHDSGDEEEERLARIAAANAAIDAIDSLAENAALPREVLDRIRYTYSARIPQLSSQSTGDAENASHGDFADAVRLAAIAAERRAVLALRHGRKIGDGALHRVQQALDLLELAIKARRPAYARASWIDLSERAAGRGRPPHAA
jgi:CPA1 family monovalent cation:H+ antiporter